MHSDIFDPNAIADCINLGGVIAYPTEAVWGLGCDPYNQSAVDKLLQLKCRPVNKGLIIVASDIEQLDFLLQDLSSEQIQKLEESWPGPVTWLIEDVNNRIPSWIKGDFSSVAVRVSAHPTVKQLCKAFGGFLVSTSLNPAGGEPALTEKQSRAYFGDKVDCYVCGDIGSSSKPSRIFELSTGRVIR